MNGGSTRGAAPQPGGRLARALRTRGTARFPGRAREPRVRFRDAVPVRRDRRDLRRRFRRAARAATGERKAETSAVLRRLSADHVRLAGVIPGTQDTDMVAVFADGTRLLLGVRCGGGGLERLGQAGSPLPVWLADAQPCFGRRRFWLWFASAGCVAPVEVLTSVSPVPPGSHESCSG
ncbi:MAG: hypothetical protein ACRDNO_03010 [Trebonia sp.]